MPFWKKENKERNLKDALETAYLMLKQNTETAEKQNIYFDGFQEKRSIMDLVSHNYNLSKAESEEIYFEAVRQMDNEWREKQP